MRYAPAPSGVCRSDTWDGRQKYSSLDLQPHLKRQRRIWLSATRLTRTICSQVRNQLFSRPAATRSFLAACKWCGESGTLVRGPGCCRSSIEETPMRKLIVPALAALLATSSFALAQSGNAGTARTGTGTSTTGISGGSDPGITDRNAAQESTSKGDRAGSGTPGSRTTGAGLSPSDRATGSKSGN
jgi:hypothetical protein